MILFLSESFNQSDDKNDIDYHTLFNLLKNNPSSIRNWCNDDYLGCCQECINSHYFENRLDKKPNTFTIASLDKLYDLMNAIHNKFPFTIDTHESYYDVPIKSYLPKYSDSIEEKSEYLIDYSNYSYGVRMALKAISGL